VRCFAHILNLVVKVPIHEVSNLYNLTNHLSYQAILSQFSHKTKATTDASEEAEDTAALNDLDNDDDEVGDDATNENEDSNKEETDDKIDPAVAASDDSIVEGIAVAIENDTDLPTLTRAEVNLGQFAVTKVTTP
jgi:hypothetical protein